MGALVRLLSLGFSVTFTAAVRGTVRLKHTPPHPFGLSLLLPVLLAGMMGLMLAARSAMADEVRLKKQTLESKNERTSQFTNDNNGITTEWTVVFQKYEFVWGGIYTNYSYQNQSESVGLPVDGTTMWRYHQTNCASAPWAQTAPALGNLLFNYRDCMDYVTNHALVTDYYVVADSSSYTNYQATWDGDFRMVQMDSTYTSDGLTDSFKYTVASEAELVTDGTNGSALFCLSGAVIDWSTGWPSGLPSGWTVAGLAPNAGGQVFKILGNGTSNNVSVALDSSLTNSVSNWVYYVSPARVQLGIEWWNPATSNWQGGEVTVITNTTVTFRVTTNMAGVVWPTNQPVWNGPGFSTSGVTTVSIPFNTRCSSDTNPFVVKVTCGSEAKVDVMVCSLELTRSGNPDFDFPGKSTERYGVGERVTVAAIVQPNVALELSWYGSWGHTWVSTNAADYSYLTPQVGSADFQAGSEAETATIMATVIDGPSFSQTWSKSVEIVEPTNIVMKAYVQPNGDGYSNVGIPLISSTNVWHINFTSSCGKRATYFLLPDDVSFAGIGFKEGVAYYVNNGVVTNALYWNSVDDTNWATHPAVIRIDPFHAAWQNFRGIAPGYESGTTNFVAANASAVDEFSIWRGNHVPFTLATQTIDLPMLYRYRSWVYQFAINTSTAVVETNGTAWVRKDNLPVGNTNYYKATFTAGDVSY